MLSGYPTINGPDTSLNQSLATSIQNALQTYGDVLKNKGLGYENMINAARAQYAPRQELAKTLTDELQPDLTKANIKNILASAFLTNENALGQQLRNPFIAREEEANIAEKLANAHFYNMGGGRGGVAAQDENRFSLGVGLDNPQLNNDPEKIREAANVLAQGGNRLSDGTILNPMSPMTKRAYDKAYKNTTTAGVITQGVRANQAGAELPVLGRAIKEGRDNYGDTILGFSPKFYKDLFNSDNKDAQIRVGNYIASEVLGFDQAALQTRINGIEPGKTIINEVLEKSKQMINAKYPRLSNVARQQALDKVDSTIKEALKARNVYGTGASAASGNQAYTYQSNNEENNKSSEEPKGRRWTVVNGRVQEIKS